MISKDFFYSIRFRLLAGLFVLLGFFISISMYGIWTSEQERYMDLAHKEAMRAGRTIEKTLRGSMLKNDRVAIRQSVAEIHAIVKPSVISILSSEGKVEVSSDESMVGKHFDRDKEASCVACHTSKGMIPSRDAIFLETEAGPVLRNIIKIPNAPACYGCHPSSQKNCGILVYDVLFAETITMLRTMLFRTALTGLLSFIFLIIVLSFIIQRYVHRPVHQLMEGFTHVGRGDYSYWVEVETKGEFQEMADQFNVMSHAIQRSFAEIKQKNWETSSLYTFVRHLAHAIEWRRLRRLITDLLYETFSPRYVVVWLAREKQERMIFEISWRQAGDPRYHHREYIIGGESDDLPCSPVSELRKWQAGELVGPIFSLDDTRVFLPFDSLGLVCMQRENGQAFSGAQKKLIIAVGEQVGIALANSRLYRMAITDGLTDLYTRRYCETAMLKLLEAYKLAPDDGFCVLMLDIDHFKLVNDTHGHQTGDEVLIQLAGLIRSSIRQDDIACRFGGEEFIVASSAESVGRWR